MNKYVEWQDVRDTLDDVCRAKCPHPAWMRFEHCDRCLLGAAIEAVENMDGEMIDDD